jgi:hypothetical protein
LNDDVNEADRFNDRQHVFYQLIPSLARLLFQIYPGISLSGFVGFSGLFLDGKRAFLAL